MLICREVPDGANVTGENGTGKIVTLLLLAGAGYVIWREYQKQSTPTPAAPTVATTRDDTRMGTVTDLNAAVDTTI